jgi:hypothetical protein
MLTDVVLVFEGVDEYQFWLLRSAVRGSWDWWFDRLVKTLTVVVLDFEGVDVYQF